MKLLWHFFSLFSATNTNSLACMNLERKHFIVYLHPILYSPLFSFTKSKSTWKYCFYNQYFTNKIFKETLNTVEIYKKEIVEIVLNQQVHIVTSGFLRWFFKDNELTNYIYPFFKRIEEKYLWLLIYTLYPIKERFFFEIVNI